MNTSEMTGKLQDKVQDYQGKFQDWQQRASETAKNVGGATDRYVRENTWMSIAFAALAGCLLGYFLSRSGD